MTDEQKEARRLKARARAQRWRDGLKADPEREADQKAKHAARSRAFRARRKNDAPREDAHRANRVERTRRWRERNRANPEWRAHQTAIRMRWRQENPEKDRASRAAHRARNAAATPGPLLGSVMLAAAPSPGRDMLMEITRLVPRCDNREDVIGEAVVLVLTGMDLEPAVREARRLVSYQFRHQRACVPIEDVRGL